MINIYRTKTNTCSKKQLTKANIRSNIVLVKQKKIELSGAGTPNAQLYPTNTYNSISYRKAEQKFYVKL